MTKKHQDKWNISFETLWLPLLLIAIFYSVAWWRYSATGRVFYVYNFGYIGTALALGVFLSSAMPQRHILWGRRIAQFLIGSYLLVYVGFVRRENMQIDLCEKNCPMDIKLLSYKDEGKRVLSTECILCSTCADVCPKDAISASMRFDIGGSERLRYKN